MAQFEILLSQAKALFGDFDAAVSAHIKALEAHRTTEGEPAPAAPHSFVERAVLRVQKPDEVDQFVPNYKIIDDTPSLEERKIALANSVTAQANAAIDAINPPLKRRLREYKYAEACQAKATAAPGKLAAEHISVMAGYEARDVKVQATYRQLAELHSDIHDLTAETIDAWKPEPFPS